MADSRNQVALYASVGPQLTHYAVDVEGAALERRGTVTLPANIHYCWPHASGRYLYVASSDSASGIGGVVDIDVVVGEFRPNAGVERYLIGATCAQSGCRHGGNPPSGD